MKRIEEFSAEDLLPGMVVAEAVVDDAGRLLIPAGAQLTESTIASLVRRDLNAIRIEQDYEEDPAKTETYRLDLISRLDHLFRHAGDGEPSRALYQAVFDHRMEHRS